MIGIFEKTALNMQKFQKKQTLANYVGKKDIGPAEMVAKDLDVAKKINIFKKQL